MIKISIIVPIYNVELYLDKCLSSLVNQTLNDIEIIAVNDGSTDKSLEILNKFKKQYSDMIKVYNKKNGGLSDARNFGIEKATGKYLLFVDSDDWIELNTCEFLYNYSEKYNYDILIFNINMVYENKIVKSPKLRKGLISKEEYIILQPSAACNKLYKNTIFSNNNIRFPVNLWYEDIALIPSLCITTNKIGCINKYFYNYYQRSNSIMNQEKFNPKIKDIIKALEYLNSFFKEDDFLKEREYLSIFCYLRVFVQKNIKFKQASKVFNLFRCELKKNYPKWYKNQYFKLWGIKHKIVAFLIYFKQYKIIRIIMK